MKPDTPTTASPWLFDSAFPGMLFPLILALALPFVLPHFNSRFSIFAPLAHPPFSSASFPRVTSHQSPLTASEDLTVHEWGTFTSIAGPDGQAMAWLPLTGSTDLPPFVEHLANAEFKGGLRGTIRMETPVLYFYSPRELTASVHATFSKGLITEWYPHASVPALDPRKDLTLSYKHTEGAITWNSVHIQPGTSGDFPADNSTTHYSAARATSAAPLLVDTASGQQREKFLFYRGVSALLPPFTATLVSDDTVQLQNHFPQQIPNVILFDRRAGKLGYRIFGPLQDQAALSTPPLDGSLDTLSSDLEGLLISQGLYPDEAHAILETWKNSWFEDGSRLLYILPRSFVDSVLPLTVTPTPASTVRVFVGRLELITPATQQTVESAFASGDRATLAHYSRFLEPILQSMIQSTTEAVRQRRLTGYLNSIYTGFYSKPHNEPQQPRPATE